MIKINTFIALLFLALPSLTLAQTNSIDECYISFNSATKLKAQSPDKLPESAATPREVNTKKGIRTVSRIAGYRVLYNNDKGAPFVNLKVEKSAKEAFSKDQKYLIENLRYLIQNSSDMKSNDVIELEYNGHKIYGLSRNSIESGSILGTFILFTNHDDVIYFYFNNLKPSYRNFNSVEDYEKQRNDFFDKYTKHINSCK